MKAVFLRVTDDNGQLIDQMQASKFDSDQAVEYMAKMEGKYPECTVAFCSVELNAGQKVTYYGDMGRDDKGEGEKGILKSFTDDEDAAFVVFKCSEDWENYQNYTGQLVFLFRLVEGWPETIDNATEEEDQDGVFGDLSSQTRTTSKRKRWALLQRILGRLHLATVVGFLVSLTVGATIALFITGAVWYWVSYRNAQIPADPPPIIHQYNP